jgi:hypothetical protein
MLCECPTAYYLQRGALSVRFVFGRIGTSTGIEQQQQAIVANHHREAASDQERAGIFRQETGRTERSSGGTLRRVGNPDVIINRYPDGCAKYGLEMTPEMATDYQSRQVFDVPEPKVVVTEHRVLQLRLPKLPDRNAGAISWRRIVKNRFRPGFPNRWRFSTEDSSANEEHFKRGC